MISEKKYKALVDSRGPGDSQPRYELWNFWDKKFSIKEM